MEFLRRHFLRSPGAVYRAYAWWAGATFVVHALFAVIAVSTLIGLILFVLTGSLTIAIVFAPTVAFFVSKGLVLIQSNSIPEEGRKFYGDARVDKPLSDIADPLCRKAGIMPITVMRSLDVEGEMLNKKLADDVSVILVRPDMQIRYTPTGLRGVIAHEIGHQCVPFGVFIGREVGTFLWSMDICTWYLRRLSVRCFRRCEANKVEAAMLLFAIAFRLLAQLSWHISASRSRQLNEYAADRYGAYLLGDPLPVAEGLLRVAGMSMDADWTLLGKEGEMRLHSHPSLASRIERLIDAFYVANSLPAAQ